MKWNKKTKTCIPDKERKVLAYSPVYKKDSSMTLRFLDGWVVKISNEITHWVYAEELIPKDETKNDENLEPTDKELEHMTHWAPTNYKGMK